MQWGPAQQRRHRLRAADAEPPSNDAPSSAAHSSAADKPRINLSGRCPDALGYDS